MRVQNDWFHPVAYEVYNVLGEIVLSGFVDDNQYLINFEDLPANVYVINLKGKTFKLIKL